jgi:6-phosphofructokinase 1
VKTVAKITGKAVVAQGGGPTAVINQSLVGAVLQARKYPWIENIYGARYGVRGIVDEEFLDLTQATTHNLEMVALTPSSGMCSTRDKPDEKYCARIFDVLRAHDVRYFYYIGGNDSADTCRIVNQNADRAGYELRVVHIPKTVDNDLLVTDHCPGYGSAAKFVAQAFGGVNLDNRSIPGVYIGVVMGRHAGYLTAASIFAKKYPDDGPHLVYVPETPFDADRFVADVDRCYKEFGRCVVAVSEGVTDKDGTPVIVALTKKDERDAHGNVQLSGTGALGDSLGELIKEKLKLRRREELQYHRRIQELCAAPHWGRASGGAHFGASGPKDRARKLSGYGGRHEHGPSLRLSFYHSRPGQLEAVNPRPPKYHSTCLLQRSDRVRLGARLPLPLPTHNAVGASGRVHAHASYPR